MEPDNIALENQILNALERLDFINRLSGLNFRDHHHETYAKYHSGTGQWLLGSDVFQGWMRGSKPSTLWCPGDPGTGKTVMMSAAVCHVRESIPDSERATSYVYFNYKERYSYQASKIWGSIARQFTEQCHAIPSEVQDFRRRFITTDILPTENDWIQLVIELSKLFKNSFIFIDALDECLEEDRDRIIDSIRKIEPYVRLFITSRLSIDLESRVSNMTRVCITAHPDDVRAFMADRLATYAKSRRFFRDSKLQADILETLSRKSNGMFLLADLHINHICKTRRALDARRALERLPNSIFEFYDDSLERFHELIDGKKELVDGKKELVDGTKELALRVLSYVICAKRSLSTDELIHALSIDSRVTDMSRGALYVKRVVFSRLSGLIRFDEESTLVRLAHPTLHEYLQRYPEKLLERHEQGLTIACLAYLSPEPLGTGPCRKPGDMIKRLDTYCFLDYACRHWSYHAGDNITDKMMENILLLLRDANRVATCAQVLYLPRHRQENWHDNYPRDFTALHAAAYWGLHVLFENLLIHYPDIDCRDSHGMRPIALSASHGHTQATERLLEANASVDAPNNRGESPLILAAKCGHETTVKLLLEWNANPAAEDTDSWTALHWAIIGKHINVVNLLLGAATTNQFDKYQLNKALILASESGFYTPVQTLLDQGAEVNHPDDQMSTPLHWAVPGGHLETSKVLLANGADPNARDLHMNVPMHWAISSCVTAQLLFSKGASVNAKNSDGQSPLLWAAHAGKLDAVEAMVDMGAAIQESNRFGFTPLHAAALKGHHAIVLFLLSKGADANAIDKDGWMALHAAGLTRRSALIELLISHTNHGQPIANRLAERLRDHDTRALMEEMAESKLAGSTGVSGLRSAINSESDQLLLKMLEDGADIDAVDEIGGSAAISYAAWLGRNDTVRLLLSHGADVDLRERSGHTALHWAASRGNKDMVVDLIKKGGATIDLKVFGWTAMLLAARMWHSQVVVYLIEQGADLRAKDYHGRSALHWACIHGDECLAKMLIGGGSEVNARDHCGQAPLHWAIAGRYLNIARLLLRSNAQHEDSTADGSTAMHIAAYTGQYDAVSMLLAASKREQRRKNRARCEVAPGKAVDVYKQDKDGFMALDMAKLTGNMDIAKLLHSKQAPSSDQDSALFMSLDDESLIWPSSEAPALQIYTDETSDYLTDDNLFNGLGRSIFSPEVRKWLLAEQEKRSRLHGLQGFGLLSLESR